ncbi:MAG: GIY-YIG nuclease family protein [Okeania sp. SIO2D1]|nr:GIY-YIG nuclease family protein [Okeania sp. SIO2D1]
MDNLPKFSGKCSLRNRSLLPDIPGIYFITNEQNNIFYIGKAQNLRKRWAGKNHHRYKQFARKGLDKVYIYYIEAPLSELDNLEKKYIEEIKPLQNDTKVKEYLPKKSPKLSELQRLLKLANTPLFPSVKFKTVNGITVPIEDWDMIRGFIAGIDDTENIPLILVICQQNMGQLLYKTTHHRTKKRFCTYDTETHSYSVNLRQAIFVFAELFYEPSEQVFKAVYPNLASCNNFGVTIKRLTNITTLVEALKNLYLLEPYMETGKITKNYILKLGNNLKLLPDNFKLNEKLVW